MLSLFYWLLAIFLINLGIFIFVLTHERRSMWAGLTLTSTLMFLALLAVDFLIVVDTEHPEQHQLISGFLQAGLAINCPFPHPSSICSGLSTLKTLFHFPLFPCGVSI